METIVREGIRARVKGDTKREESKEGKEMSDGRRVMGESDGKKSDW